MKRRGLLIAAVGLCLVGSALLAKPGIVKTKEGQVYDGEVEDKAGDDFITVTVRGITTRIDRADVESVSEGHGLDDEYKERLAKLDPADAKRRMELARWAFGQRRYDLARDAADKALEVDPNSADATQFLTLVQSQERMERARARAATQRSTTGEGATTTSRANAIDWKLLTPEDVNRIRQEELRLTDVRARFQFRNDVERRFLASHRQYTLSDWRALPLLQRAIMILDQGDPQLRGDVIITTDPGSILEYRRLVQPVAISTCAAAACHGGAMGGDLILNTTGDTNEAATYTNFYILQRYSKSMEAPGERRSVFGDATTYQMVDRTHAEDSLFLQYGLPRNAAKVPHPDVPGFRPAFNKGREDTKYQAIMRWIGTTLAPIEPNYGIDYEPPTGASSAAATTPAGHVSAESAQATTRATRKR